MKFVKKSDCKFAKGYILGPDGETIMILPASVRVQLEELDRVWQIYNYLDEQDRPCAGPTLEGFHRETFDDDRAWKMPEAPVCKAIEKRVKETQAYLEDIDRSEKHDALVFACGKWKDLLNFCADECFVTDESGLLGTAPLKCARLGNPLELKADDVIAMIKAMIESDISGFEIVVDL